MRERRREEAEEAAGDEEEAFPGGWRAEITGPKQAVIHLIPEMLQLPDEAAECLPFVSRIGFAVRFAEASPVLEFLHVLKHDHAGPYLLRPFDRNPGKTADLVADGLGTFGLGKVLAVRRKPGEPDGATGAGFDRVNLPDILGVMLCAGMIRAVHGDGSGIVVDGDVHAASDSDLDASAGSAATGEIVNDDFLHWVLRFLKAAARSGCRMPPEPALRN